MQEQYSVVIGYIRLLQTVTINYPPPRRHSYCHPFITLYRINNNVQLATGRLSIVAVITELTCSTIAFS